MSIKALFLSYLFVNLYNNTVSDDVKRLAKVKVSEILCSPQFHHSWHSGWPDMIYPLPSHLLLPHVPRNVFQEDLVHDFPKCQSKTDQLGVSQIIHWTFLNMVTKFVFLQY